MYAVDYLSSQSRSAYPIAVSAVFANSVGTVDQVALAIELAENCRQDAGLCAALRWRCRGCEVNRFFCFASYCIMDEIKVFFDCS